MSNISTGRLSTIVVSVIFFAGSFGMYLWMDMMDGSPKVVSGKIVGYYVMDHSAMAIVLMIAILCAITLILALVWPYVAGNNRSDARPAGLQCPRCAAPVGKDYMACPACTLPLLQICPGCGERLPASYNACPRCGAVIRNPHSP